MKSFNKQIICEPYVGSKGIKAKITSGVSTPEQKTSLVGLRVLEDAYLDPSSANPFVKNGDFVYIKEEILHVNKALYGEPLKCKDLDYQFILVNFAHVSFIKESNGL